MNPIRKEAVLKIAVVLAGGLVTTCAMAEYCWVYDDQQAYTKFACSGPTPTNQTVEEKHNEWHNCFGSIGTAAAQPFRGQRFIAFHRQLIQEFNLDRATRTPPFDKIETWDASQGLRFTLPYPACSFGANRNCDNNGDGDCVDAVDDVVLCNGCEDLPPCFSVNSSNTTACNPFGYTHLDQFANADEIGIALDAGSSAWHASFHGGVATADGDPGTAGVQACTDIDSTSSATGEPMFWRAHQKLDDVLTDWQVRNAVDVVMVLDRSGSMASTVPDGDTKLEKAVEAAKLFAAMVRGSTNGSENRIGLVSFSSSAINELGLTNSTAAISADGNSGSVITALNNITTGGATSIGAGIENARCMLCPDSDSDSDCDSDDCLAASGNPRKAVLLLSDGLENTQPCLDGADAPCVGTEVNYEGTAPFRSLGYTQMCAVGYGEETVLDGDLLNELAEMQGGIYISGATGNDLKEYFAKCYGELTPEFIGLDPKGVLASNALVSEAFTYNSCSDSAMTFTLGWQEEVSEGDVSLAITAPSGRRVDLGDPVIRTDIDSTWHFVKVPLPYESEDPGQWTARVVRPHRSFVNGFVSDAFVDHEAGVSLVRTEIQRLCKPYCNVLYFEDGSLSGNSVYADALKAEAAIDSVANIDHTSDADEFLEFLESDRQWDLYVYANQLESGEQPFDGLLRRTFCRRGTAAIATDNRDAEITAPLFKCLDAARDGVVNMDRIVGDGRIANSLLMLKNPGYRTFTYGLKSGGPGDAQALFYDRMFSRGMFSSMIRGKHDPAQHKRPPSAAVMARGEQGKEVNWFANVAANGQSRLRPHEPRSNLRTGDVLKPSVRITESFRPIGGYDEVVARVEITPPARGLGTVLMKQGQEREATTQDGDPQSLREARFRHAMADHSHGHPHSKTFLLYDDGTHGDNYPDNHYWTAEIPDFTTVDGNYQYRFIVDLTKNGCTQRREVAQTVYVDVGVDANRTPIAVTSLPAGDWEFKFTPRDKFGNFWGPGRSGLANCSYDSACKCYDREPIDHGDGSYTIVVNAQPGTSTCPLEAFGSKWSVPLLDIQGVAAK